VTSEKEKKEQFGERPAVSCINKITGKTNYHPIEKINGDFTIHEVSEKSDFIMELAWKFYPLQKLGLDKILFELFWQDYYLTIANINTQDGLYIKGLGYSHNHSEDIWTWELKPFKATLLNKLVLLASYHPLNLTQIKQDFKVHFPKLGDIRLELAETFLKQQAAGAVSFTYQEKLKENFCD
jgi:hypothetical protein